MYMYMYILGKPHTSFQLMHEFEGEGSLGWMHLIFKYKVNTRMHVHVQVCHAL